MIRIRSSPRRGRLGPMLSSAAGFLQFADGQRDFMKKSRMLAPIVTLLVVLSLTVVGCGNEARTTPDTLRMAVTELQGLEELQREFGAFQAKFEELSGYELKFFPVNDRTAAAVALEANQVDVVFTGPAEYVAINARTKATPIVSITRPGYRSVIYTTTASGITTVAGLKGQSIAMDDVGSTSGHLGPSWLLAEGGVDPRVDVKVFNVGDSVHEALRRGDVAAVGIVYYAYEDYLKNDDPSKYRVIVEGDTLPPDVIMAREGLDVAVRDTVERVFTESWDQLLPALLEGQQNSKYAGAQVIETNDADYDIVRDMYRVIGVDDFAGAPE